ncbi:hypothetical protein T4E_6711 [Trichinella pseudospiralis]|uniref:Uncharacterized protein n=1 Tax=Trichinella pseudospiralis TaxID=6337 RepID=A0A0V0YIY4_TRIPS|nr:hypothetical protein T4E_6711 [Trichinella pseudospiralis]
MKFCQKKIDSLIDWVNLETENGIELMPVDSLCALKDFQHLSFIISSTFREEPPFPAERNCRNYVYYVLQNFYEKDLFNNLESLASINGDNPTEEEVAIALCLTLNYALTSVNNTDHVQLVLTKVTTESQYLIKDVCEGLSNPAEVAVNWSTFWERLLGNVDLESNGYTNGDAKHAENQNGTSVSSEMEEMRSYLSELNGSSFVKGSASFLNNSSPVVKSLNSPVVRNAAAVRQKDQEIRRLKETIASKNEIIETLAYDVETLTKTCAVRETELLVLQGDQSSAEALRAELKEKHELLESVKNENALLLEEIKSYKVKNNMNAQTMIRRMRAEEMMLKSELNEQSVISSEKETNCKRTVEDLMKQIDVLKKEKRDIVDECDELQLKVENLTQANNEIRLNFMRLHEKYRNLKSKLASIEEKEINASEEPPQVLKSFADAAVQTSFILSSPQLLNNVAEENEEFGANEEFAVPEALKSDEMKILTMQSNLSQGKNIFRLPSKESTMPKYISGSSVAESNGDEYEYEYDFYFRASSSSMATVASVYSFSSTVQASQISKPIGNEGDLFSCSVLKRVGDKSNLVVEERVIESSKCRSPHKLDVTAYGTERVLKSYRSGEGLFTPTIKLNYDAMISFANVLSSSRVHNDDGENEASTLNNESDLKWDDRLSVLHLRNQKVPLHLKSIYPIETQYVANNDIEENVKCAAEFSASHLVRSNLPTPVNTQFTNPAKKTVLQSIRRAFCIRKRTKGEKMNAKTDLNKSVLSQETCTSAASSVTNLVDITENAPQQKIESNTSGNSQKWFSFVINNTPPKKRPNNKKKQK